jgi:Mn2+/Fe2+ NRAMP family transporter
MLVRLRQLGPGLLFAAAAIGVSHLVQSTRAGADYGLGLLWALLLVHVFKYPFFQFGPRYAAATKETLLHGYYKLGKWVLLSYVVLSTATMFTIQAAVTIVTAGLAKTLFSNTALLADLSTETWTIILLLICLVILVFGKYRALDKTVKIIIVLLSLSTLAAVIFAFRDFNGPVSFRQVFPKSTTEIAFLIAFMGWMPAPLDISIWHSLWSIEKHKMTSGLTPRSALFDFNIGFLGAIFLGVVFVCLGYFVMYNSGETFSPKALVFSNQIIEAYTNSLGNWSYLIIAIAAFTTMFSTTITTLDASPRSMSLSLNLLLNWSLKRGYLIWIVILTAGTLIIFFAFASEMGLLIKIATILSFVTAPFYALANYFLITSKHTPAAWRPSLKLKVLSWLGILFLIGFSAWYLSTF